MKVDEFNQELIGFLDGSPTPFHAVESMKSLLNANGYVELKETDSWQFSGSESDDAEAGAGKYFVTRNDSSIIAFAYRDIAGLLEKGFHMVGAHTDSPCLKVKPTPEITKKGYQQLGVEVYGGALLNPWFDRDLSLAGRVSYRTTSGDIAHGLLDFEKAIGMIPSLAIHLDREANKNRSVNPQLHLPVILGQGEDFDFRDMLKAQLEQQEAPVDAVLDYEMLFYDTQGAAATGLNDEFIASARLDNLLSCFIGLAAQLEADGSQPSLLVCNDHEEVGSLSAAGADGPFLETVLSRLLPDINDRARVLAKSQMISADNAHGVHPNYADKHDNNHGPLLNAGPVIKINANQRYATNSETSALFRHLADQANVPVQVFTVRTDMGCGSTIGPITAGKIGVSTLDVGVPTFGMHSIRELSGSKDAHGLYLVLKQFFQ